jgi:hypothetical protein
MRLIATLGAHCSLRFWSHARRESNGRLTDIVQEKLPCVRAAKSKPRYPFHLAFNLNWLWWRRLKPVESHFGGQLAAVVEVRVTTRFLPTLW